MKHSNITSKHHWIVGLSIFLALSLLMLVAKELPASATSKVSGQQVIDDNMLSVKATLQSLIPIGQPQPTFPQTTSLPPTTYQHPLSFVPNEGQADPTAQFLLDYGDYTVQFGQGQVRFLAESNSIELRFLGANPASAGGQAKLPGVVNYYLGLDAYENIPTFAGISYQALYPGIDLRYGGDAGKLKSEFVVAPHADPSQIVLDYAGIHTLTINDNGDLVAGTPAGDLIETAPYIYQEIDGKRVEIAGNYQLLTDHTATFQIGDYDPTSPLIIDPYITYSNFDEYFDNFSAIALHPTDGNQRFLLGMQNQLVTIQKINNTTTEFTTIIGDNKGQTIGEELIIGADGKTYIVGTTRENGFYTTSDALDRTCGDIPERCTNYIDRTSSDAFFIRLGTTGQIEYSTYIGGAFHEFGTSIQLNGNDVILAGSTNSSNFPNTTNAVDGICNFGESGCGRKIPGYGIKNVSDGFVVYLTANGNKYDLTHATYVGDEHDDRIEAIVFVDMQNLYIAGVTTPFGARVESFVTTLDLEHSLEFSHNRLTGIGDIFIADIAYDSSGLYVVGYAEKDTLPIVPAYFDQTFGGNGDGFLIRYDNTLQVKYATYLGGSDFDFAKKVLVDEQGTAIVLGETYSTDFYTIAEVGNALSGGQDIFFSQVEYDASPFRPYSKDTCHHT